MATRPVIVEGERNVVITAPTNNSLIISGDNNTVEMALSGSGALLAHAFRWNRPRPRGRRARPLAPVPFERHVDRDADVAALVGRDGEPRVANVYGSQGLGKTHVVVAALNRPQLELRDGTIYLDARGRDAADCLHAVFDELFECRVPLRDLRVERHLADRRAVIALEDVALDAADAQRLVLAAPGCRFILTSAKRVLYDGTALALAGLADEHVAAIAEQELGRALSGRERAAAEAVGAALGGHPLRLRQTFGRAREQGLSIEALAPRAASDYDRAAQLSGRERAVARTLAVHGDAPLGVEHIEALAGPGAQAAARALEARHDARSHSPRYSLVGALDEAFGDDDLQPEIDRALEYFAGWAESDARAGRRERVLAEADALVALLERAQRVGRHEQILRLGPAIEWALVVGGRWQAWGQVLELVLSSARAIGDTLVEGWALHELGTRRFGLGNAAGAAAELRRALALREHIGDEAGAAATRRNLAVAQGPQPLAQRISHLSIALLGAIVALLIVGAVATGAAVLDGSSKPEPEPSAPGKARLSIDVSGSGRGSVVSAGRRIRCADTCAFTVRQGRRLVLYARSSTSQFTGWSGDCDGPSCSLPMRDDSRVTATFSRIDAPRRLSVDIDGRGRVVSVPPGIDCPGTCSAPFRRGRRVRLSATPSEALLAWSGACKTTGPCEVAMDADASVRARFGATDPAGNERLEVEVEGAGTVTGPDIDCEPTCSASVERGRTVTLVAHDGDGTFSRWTGPCADDESARCVVRVDGETRVVAVFDDAPVAETVSLTVHVAGKGRGIVRSQPAGIDCEPGCRVDDLHAGDHVTLTAKAAAGSTFVGWEGFDCPGSGPCDVTIGDSNDVTARFEPEAPPRLTVEATNLPSPNPLRVYAGKRLQSGCAPGTCEFPRGTVVTVTAPGVSVQSWSGCTTPPVQQEPCFVTMDADRRIVVDFYPPPR